MKLKPYIGFVLWHPNEEQAAAATPSCTRIIVDMRLQLGLDLEDACEKLGRCWEVEDFVKRREAHESEPRKQLEVICIEVAT